MNIHHLELFYYVARHGGISRAVRNMPYGIQQPAVSSQMLLLEQDLGTRLFERQPFQLSREGEELYAFVRPFFEGLDGVAARLRQRSAPLLRLGAAEFVLRDYLPAVMAPLQARHPGLQLGLRSGLTPELVTALQERAIDLALTPLEGKPPARVRVQRLVRLPLALLVPKASKLKSAAELWKRDRITEPLIGLPEQENISRIFQRGLKRLWVDWPLAIEASSLDLIGQYVANGYGIGVTLNTPEVARSAAVRLLPLPDFEPVEIAAMWFGEPTPLLQTMLEETQRFVARQWPQWQCH
ncbi:MAG: LysR family transcriptional regulator [Opitutae bacterium]|nr:LysR family transcriptional regulator [Opitutae bacterium]